MKILHVTKKYPNALGGDAVVVTNLEKQQKAHGHEVAILTSNCDEIKNGKHIYKFGLKDTPAALDNITVKRLFSLIMLFFKAFAVIRKEKPDVIHTCSVDMAFFVSFAARHYKIPIVHTFQILTYYDPNQSLLRRKTELLFARGAKAKAITAPNQYDVDKLKEAGLQQSVVLPNGIDIDWWKVSQKSKKPDVFTFITAGRLEEQKGNEHLVRAAALLRESTKKPFKVVIIGEGSLEQELKALAKNLNVQESVVFAGRKTPDEIRDLGRSSHAVIIPSLYETTPLTLLEAWCMNLPVVSTPVGIVRDINRKIMPVELAEIADASSLAQAMLRLIEDDKRREAVASAGQKEVQQYAWDSVYKIAQAIYQKAVQ